MLDADAVGVGVVERAEVRVERAGVLRRVARRSQPDAVERVGWLGASREHRDALVAILELRELGAQRIGRDELRRRARCVMRGERSRRARRTAVRHGGHLSEYRRDGFDADPAGAQQHRRRGRERDDRAFDADVARAAVEDQVDGVAEVVGDVLRRCRRHVTEAVGRRGGHAAAEFRQQRSRHRMRRCAQPDARLAAGDGIVDVTCARHDERERAGPECGGERARLLRYGGRPALRRREVRHVDDHRMIGRPPLCLEDAAHRGCVARVRAQSVHGFGWERDELAVGEQPRGLHDGCPVGPANGCGASARIHAFMRRREASQSYEAGR